MSTPFDQADFVKIQVYCPQTHADALRWAIGQAGAGAWGNYSHVAFVTPGKSYFMPMPGAQPFIGEVGEVAAVDEVRIEFFCRKCQVKTIVAVMLDAHPYEVVAYDILPVLSLANFE